jgi:predicted homoserine dehydrogenase-like protein
MRGARVIIVDAALKAREAAGNPVRVAKMGAGFTARDIANQIFDAVPGMRLCGIANRHLDGAQRALTSRTPGATASQTRCGCRGDPRDPTVGSTG